MEKKKELLYDGVLYDVTEWSKRHPGGRVIDMYISTGEDSTLAVDQFHQRSTKKVMSIMKSLPRRKLTEQDSKERNMDPKKEEKNKAMTKDFLELYDTLKKEGFFNPDPFHVLVRVLEIFSLCAVGVYCLQLRPQNLVTTIVGIFFLALGSGRAAWLQHEGAHNSLLGKPKLDKALQSFLCGIFMALSASQWSSIHSRHHAMPQHMKHDVDIQSVPLIAFHKDTVKNPKDGKRFFIQNQKWLFALCDTFIITMTWKVYMHPLYCISKRKYSDLVYMTLHYIIFIGAIGFSNYIIITWLASIYLLGNFTLSHSHLPVTNEPTHWVEYSLIHSANVRSSWWVDYWMGNLNYQIEHHLFPTMPQYRNKYCRERVKALAKKHNLPYHLYSYAEAVKKSFDNLATVSKELAATAS